MKAHILTVAMAILLVGCKPKAVEPEPVETAPATETEAPPAEAQPAAETEEAPPDMIVSLEDIEKAAQAYALLHDENMSMEDKKAKFDQFLADNQWALDAYADVMYDIARNSPSRVQFMKKIAE